MANLSKLLFFTTADVQQLPTVHFPIGTIIAWVSQPVKIQKGNASITDTLPSGWTQCDGRQITEGPWVGRTTPDLNNGNLFLRGGTEVQMLEYEADMILDHLHTDSGHTHVDTGHAHLAHDYYDF